MILAASITANICVALPDMQKARMAIPYVIHTLKQKHVSVEFDHCRGQWFHSFTPYLTALESDLITEWSLQQFARIKRKPLQIKPDLHLNREMRLMFMIFNFKAGPDNFLTTFAMKINKQFGPDAEPAVPIIRTVVLPAPRRPIPSA